MPTIEELQNKLDKYELHISDLQDEVFKLEALLDVAKAERDSHKLQLDALQGGNLFINKIPTGYCVRTMFSPVKYSQGVTLAVALIEFLSEHCGYFPIMDEKEKDVEKVAKVCVWTCDEDGIYQTNCGQSFYFDCGTATENKASFCMYCGKSLKDVEKVEGKAA